jgi:excisionase family DNA binding protein
MNSQPTKLMTPTEVATELGCHPETIRRALRRGDLACFRMRGVTRIAPEHLNAYLETSLCPVSRMNSLTSNGDAEVGQSSGGKLDVASEFRLERRMRASLDKRSLTMRPGLKLIP